MVTASHNDNGWTGVKMGANRPMTFGPEETTRLKEIVTGGQIGYSRQIVKTPKGDDAPGVVIDQAGGLAEGAKGLQVIEAVVQVQPLVEELLGIGAGSCDVESVLTHVGQ